jgi:hypothetical protein
MLDAPAALSAKPVETQTVLLWINLGDQPGAQERPLRRIDLAFKNRILDALTEIQARLGHPAKSFGASSAFGADVIGDQHEHNDISYFQMNAGYPSRSPRK